jgi:pyrroloquinoline-quinone synthase
MTDFVTELDTMIYDRRKMTSSLYQTILAGKATKRLLQNFVIHRWPVKSTWTRHLLGIASRVDDYALRSSLVANIYEEETGALSGSKRHLETFADFGAALGVARRELEETPWLPETKALVEHNLRQCNDTSVHFTAGVAAVILLMEGQPPIVDKGGSSMLAVMRDVYGLPPSGYEFFVHHASSDVKEDAVSDLEDEHAYAARQLLRHYCTTDELRATAREALATALELRHRHFDAILDRFYDPAEPAFRYEATAA